MYLVGGRSDVRGVNSVIPVQHRSGVSHSAFRRGVGTGLWRFSARPLRFQSFFGIGKTEGPFAESDQGSSDPCFPVGRRKQGFVLVETTLYHVPYYGRGD